MTEQQPQSIDTGEPTGMPNLPADQPMGGPVNAAPLTDEEQKKVRSAAILAGSLVSGAEPGFFDAFKESMAAGRALQSASPEIQQIMKGGGLPEMPQAQDKAGLETAILAELTGAKQLLAAKSPALADGFRDFVLQSCHDVAEAAKGTWGAEQGVITKVEQALA